MKRTVLTIFALSTACVATYATTIRSERSTPDNGLEITDIKSSSTCRGLCLAIDKRPSRVGEPITGAISWNHAVPGSDLTVYLMPPVNRVGNTANSGRYGSLMRRAFTIPKGSGSFRFRWRGSGFWCAPTDFPMICDEAPAADTYWIMAVVEDRHVSPIAFLQRGPSSDPIKLPRILAKVRIGPFTLK